MSAVQVGPRTGPSQPRPPVETPASRPEAAREGLLSRRYSLELPFDPWHLPVLVIMAVALALRLWDLGAKALHHDESLHAVYSWYLYQGRGYTHDPMMHGPILYFLNAIAYFVLGASDFSARVMPAIFGTLLVGMPWLLRNELGRMGALAASVLLAISPSTLYFSRFIRHDVYVDTFTMLMVVGVFRYVSTGHRPWFYVTVVGAALLFATKASFYISGFMLFVFLAAAWFVLRGETRQLYRAHIRELGWRPWLIGAAVFLAINVVLYTTVFTNLRGLCTAFVTLPFEGCNGARATLNYWWDQQGVQRGGQPWFYYLMLLPLYEFLPLVLGLLSFGLVRKKNLFYWFTAWWFLFFVFLYSWAGEKMPWMLQTIGLPLILLAGRQLGDWLEAGWGRRAVEPRGLAVGGLVLLIALSLVSWITLGAARVAAPVEQQTVTLQRLALSVVVAVAAGGLVTLSSRWGRRYILPGLAFGTLAILGAATIRTSVLVNYDHPDTPVEPLIYVQSSPDTTWVTREIERVAAQTGQGKDLRILMDNGWGDGVHESVAWPFEWYLRDYKNRRYFTRTIDPNLNLADYPVILAMAPNIEPIQEQLRQYNTGKYRLNWWFPEDYKSFNAEGPQIPGTSIGLPALKLDLIFRTLSDPQNQLKFAKFIMYREVPNEMGAREFIFGVHQAVPQVGPAQGNAALNAGVPAAQPAAAREAVAQTLEGGTVVYGRNAAGQSVLADPKGVARGADGRIYVVEARTNRVTVFNEQGGIDRSWGSQGQGDGQFQEPWGIAVGPNGDVYVADTWNHRIQRFDGNGQFKGKWGRLGDAKGTIGPDGGVFWGPRSIAISPQGELYVTDTGNKRVQVFDLDGNFKRMFGGMGDQPGQLHEPVGIALDAEGNVWVADAWNRRIQKLDPSGQPLAQLPVAGGWEATQVTNKPYIAVDGQGRILATFPDQGRVMVYGQDGREITSLQVQQGGSAVGIAAAPDNRALVVDARNGIVGAFRLP